MFILLGLVSLKMERHSSAYRSLSFDLITVFNKNSVDQLQQKILTPHIILSESRYSCIVYCGEYVSDAQI
jgi:hypothetical protein